MSRILKPQNVKIYPIDFGVCVETSDINYEQVKTVLNAMMGVYGVQVEPISEKQGAVYAAFYYKMTGRNPAHHPKLKSSDDGSLRFDNVFFINPASIGVKTPEETYELCQEILEHLRFFEVDGVILQE